ncbi:MAG: caspase family protein [Saprospiraceae bacterium]
MKVLYTLTVSFLVLSQSLLAQHSSFALLIGVGNYPSSSGWQVLSSKNDLEILSKTLISHGIKKDNISILKDAEVDRKSVLHMIETQLINKVHSGDMAYFHFSGHGQQIKDKNGDELDGLDEALVSYYSPKQFNKGVYEGEELILDDDLSKVFARLRRKLGSTGRLIISIDACHSGSVLRSNIVARGTDVIMAEPNFIPSNQEEDNITSMMDFTQIESNILAPEISLLSSGPNQMSYEYTDKNKKSYGLFTYALCKSLNELGPEANYKMWLEKIWNIVNTQTSLQTPYLEGKINEKIFDRNLSSLPAYYIIKKIIAPDIILMNAGLFNGISEGSKVALYDEGNLKNIIATGVVDDVNAFDAEVILNKKIKISKLKNYKVVVSQIIINEKILKLKLINSNYSYFTAFEKTLSKNCEIILPDEIPDLIISTQTLNHDSTLFQINSGDGSLIWTQLKSANLSDEYLEISQFLKKYARVKQLIELETKDEFLKASIEITTQDSFGKFKLLRSPELFEGQIVRLQIHNLGKSDFYFSVFDIRPDLSVEKLFPPLGNSALDYHLPIGGSFIGDSFRGGEFTVNKPYGNEVLKIVCTKEPIEYGDVRGNSNKGNNPIEKLINNLTLIEDDTRGVSVAPTLSSENGYIGTLTFKIKTISK